MELDYTLPKNITDLPVVICTVLNLPESGIDCSLSNPNICVRCPYQGRFITWDNLNDYHTGYIVSIIIWICTVIIGTFGTVTNSIIILVLLGKKEKRKSFELLLFGLACWDLMGSVTSVVASTFSMIVLENWDRGFASKIFTVYGSLLCYLARSGSTYLTVLIAIERYLVIAFPLRSIHWFTLGKTKCLMGLMLLIPVICNVPRFISFKIVPNYIGRDIPSIMEWNYIAVNTSMDEIWSKATRARLSAIDFCVPLPLLLIFNVLIHVEILKSNSRRKELMSANQEREIKAVKMFVPVVLVLFICNVEAYAHFYYIIFERILVREHCFGVLLSIAVNSAANLPIYYFKGDRFKDEVKALFSSGF